MDQEGTTQNKTPWEKELSHLVRRLTATGISLPTNFAQAFARDIENFALGRSSVYRGLSKMKRGSYILNHLLEHPPELTVGRVYWYDEIVYLGSRNGIIRALHDLRDKLDLHPVDIRGRYWMSPEPDKEIEIPSEPSGQAPGKIDNQTYRNAWSLMKRSVESYGYVALNQFFGSPELLEGRNPFAWRVLVDDLKFGSSRESYGKLKDRADEARRVIFDAFREDSGLTLGEGGGHSSRGVCIAYDPKRFRELRREHKL